MAIAESCNSTGDSGNVLSCVKLRDKRGFIVETALNIDCC